MPRSVKIRVASGVVGPFASTTMSALISCALSSVIWLEIALALKYHNLIRIILG